MRDRTREGRLSRRALLGGLAASAGTAAVAGAPERSRFPTLRPDEFWRRALPSSESLVTDAGLSGKVGFAVADVDTGLMLETRYPLASHPPASTTKALTTLYALDTLGGDYRFPTELRATGPIKDGKLEGDLILVGGGDPTLDTDVLGDMAAELKETGLREIAGTFRVWGGALPQVPEIDEEQPDYVSYNPAVGGLNLNFNRVHFEWKRAKEGYAVSMDARSARFRPEVAMARMRVVDRRGPVYTYEDAGGVDDWTVARGALGSSGARWLPVRRPARYSGEVFQALAKAQGIDLGAEVGVAARPDGTVIVRHQSDRLAPVLKDMLKYSTNLTAEVVGMTATRERTGPAEGLDDSAARMSGYLADAMGCRSADFEDHSGLGDDNRITPTDMVRALVRAGPDGELRHLMKHVPVHDRPDLKVQAKTGTLNFCSALAGYIAAPGGKTLAFSILTSDVPKRDALPMEQREKPPGGHAWLTRSRVLQSRLLSRWATVFGA